MGIFLNILILTVTNWFFGPAALDMLTPLGGLSGILDTLFGLLGGA